MRMIRILVKSSLPLFLVASVASILTGLSSTMVIKAIHSAIKGGEFDLNAFSIEFFTYWLIYGILSVVASYAVSLLTQRIIHKLRVDLSHKILDASFATVEENQSRLLPILTEDIKTIAYSIDRLPGVTTGLATVLGILGYMVWYSPKLSLATLVIFVSVFLFTQITLPYVRKYAGVARDYLDQIYVLFEGLVFGIKELTLNREFKKSYMEEQIIPASKLQNKYYLKENVIAAITNRSTDMILLLGMAVLIIIIYNTGFVTLEFFGEYLTLVLFTLAPLSTAAGFLSSLKRIEVSLDHIEQVGITMEDSTLKEESTEKAEWKKEEPLLEMKGIEHTYYHSEAHENFTMGPVDLAINSGEMLFLIGGNGSGKTTLAKILLGLYEPEKGTINYKGVPITGKLLSYYRSRFSAIFADSYVFDKLLHIEESKVKERGQELIEMLELTKKVSIENGAFSTKKLSDGQKKRLLLIISILEDKEIYLFDEWAANQDPYFKEVFYLKILPYLRERGKTLIVITHDDRYFDEADRIVKLRDGKPDIVK